MAGDHRPGRGVYGQPEDVWSVVVPNGVEEPSRRVHRRQVHLGGQNALLVSHRAGEQLTGRVHDDAVSGFDPFAVFFDRPDALAIREVSRDLVNMTHGLTPRT